MSNTMVTVTLRSWLPGWIGTGWDVSRAMPAAANELYWYGFTGVSGTSEIERTAPSFALRRSATARSRP